MPIPLCLKALENGFKPFLEAVACEQPQFDITGW